MRERAAGLCEYCHASERWQYVRFTMDHVTPLADDGPTTADNLALACFHCNRRKWMRRAIIDPKSGAEVPLFNPRTDSWPDHFIWSSDCLRIVGLSDIGRATVIALEFNRAWALDIRAADVPVGRHPPAGDPVPGANQAD